MEPMAMAATGPFKDAALASRTSQGGRATASAQYNLASPGAQTPSTNSVVPTTMAATTVTAAVCASARPVAHAHAWAARPTSSRPYVQALGMMRQRMSV